MVDSMTFSVAYFFLPDTLHRLFPVPMSYAIQGSGHKGVREIERCLTFAVESTNKYRTVLSLGSFVCLVGRAKDP